MLKIKWWIWPYKQIDSFFCIFPVHLASLSKATWISLCQASISATRICYM